MRGAHTSERKFKAILKAFVSRTEANIAAKNNNLNRHSVEAIYSKIRQRIALINKQEEIRNVAFAEVDESYFGAKRVRGKAGRGAKGKTIVFGLRSGNKVHAEKVPNCRRNTLIPIIVRCCAIDARIHSDGFKSYKCLKKMGYDHKVIKHSEEEFSKVIDGEKVHTNGIETAWSCCKTKLSRYRGIHPSRFDLYLAECVFRFNHRQEDIYMILLSLFRADPIAN